MENFYQPAEEPEIILTSDMTPEEVQLAAELAVFRFEKMHRNEAPKNLPVAEAPDEKSGGGILLEKFRDAESSEHRIRKAWSGLSKQLGTIGVLLPALLQPAEAVTFADIQAASEPSSAESSVKPGSNEQSETHASFGESEKISADEWKLYQRYKNHVYSEGLERITHYGISQTGKVLEVPGEEILGVARGDILFGEDQKAQLKIIDPLVKIVTLHQHPLSVFRGTYQMAMGEYENQPSFFRNSDPALIEQQSTIDLIKEGKILSAWPPSANDAQTALLFLDEKWRVADASGIWTIQIDMDSYFAKERLAKGSYSEKYEEKCEEIGISKNDLKLIRSANKKRKVWQPWDKLSDQEVAAVEKQFHSMMEKVDHELKREILGSFETQEFIDEYSRQQLLVAQLTSNRDEWEQHIDDFIQYCKKNGLRVTYTLYPKAGERKVGETER